MKKVNVGIDIGIASVGWAIMDEDNKIILHGVRLFDTVDDPKDSKLLNENRREKRSSRRRLWRLATRKRDAIKLLIREALFKPTFSFNVNNQEDLRKKDENKDILFVKDFREYIAFEKNEKFDIYGLRKRLLNEKLDLSNKDLLRVLYWYAQHRGFSYQDVESKKDNLSEDLFSKVKNLLKKKNNRDPYIAEIQYEILNNPEFLPEKESDISKVRETVGKFFSRSQYKEELKVILNNLGFSETFINEYMTIIYRERSFEEGPGSEKSHSKYGIWGDLDEKGKPIYSTIWEKTVKKCVYTGEPVIAKASFSYYLFSLLNYLNNLSYEEQKLNEESKKNLILNIFKLNTKNEWPNKWSNVTHKQVIEIFKKQFGDHVDEFAIKGWVAETKEVNPENRKIKPVEELFKVKNFSDMNEIFTKNNFVFKKELNVLNLIDLIDEIADILQKSTVKEKRIEQFKCSKVGQEIESKFDYLGINREKDLENIYSLLADLKGFSQTGNISRKLTLESNEYMLKNPVNFNKFIDENNLKPNNTYKFREYIDTKKLTTDWIKNAPVSPTVKRSFTQATNVLNAIFKLAIKNNWEINDVAIETARESNNKEQRDIIANINKINENRKKQFEAYFEGKKNDPSPTLLLKLLLLEEQGQYDFYDGQKIDPNDLINNQWNYEIDHIIPWSMSFDNSFSNKVVTKKENNQRKSNQTAYQFLSSDREKFKKLEKLWNEKLPATSIGKQKLENLKKSNEDFQSSFIGRNLNDTRSSVKIIMGVLNSFKEKAIKEKNPNFQNLKVKTTTGSFTSFLRKLTRKNYENNEESYSKLIDPVEKLMTREEKKDINKKNRLWNGHHAQDAVLAIYAVQNPKYNSLVDKEYKEDDKRSEAKLKKVLDHEYYKTGLNDLVVEMNSKRDQMKFSKKINFFSNTSFHNETIYKAKSIDEQIYQVESKNLSEIEAKDYDKYFNELNPKFYGDKLLIYSSDKNHLLWKALKSIFEQYRDSGEKFPFKKAIALQNDSNKNFINQNKNPELVVKYKNSKSKNVIKKISKIRYVLGKPKSSLKMIRIKNNRNSFFSGLNWLWIDIFSFTQKGKEKMIVVPANAINIEIYQNSKDVKHYDFKNEKYYDIFGELPKINHNDKISYRKEYYQFLIDLTEITKSPITNFRHFHRIFKNTILLKKHNLIKEEFDDFFYVVGHSFDQYKLEIKRLKTQKLHNDKEQIQETINTFLKGWYFVDIDILGNIYNKKEIK